MDCSKQCTKHSYWCHHHTGQGNSFAISDGDIGGLVNGTAYYITHDTHNTIKLATSLSNANNNTNINLTSVGSGSSHSLTVGFDGINKIFKATHNGDDVHINNSTQLQIAINNVVQKPNNDAAFTRLQVIHTRQIQFKILQELRLFWDTVIANTIEHSIYLIYRLTILQEMEAQQFRSFKRSSK